MTTTDTIPYETLGIELQLHEFQQTPRSVKAIGVSISKSGVTLRVKGFCHAGTQCVVLLPTPAGTTMNIASEIIGCTHSMGLIHTIELRFHETIELDLFDPSAETNPNAAPDTPEPRPTRRLLVVDDHDAYRTLLRSKLGRLDFDIESAEHIGSALDLLRAQRFDAIICDLHLDDASGTDLLHAAVPELHKGPFVFISAEPSSATLRELITRGAHAVLSKPLDFNAAADTIRDLIDGQASALGFDADNAEQRLDDETAAFRDALANDLLVLQRSAQRNEIDVATNVCRNLAGCAPGFGFNHLGRAADRALTAIQIAGVTENQTINELVEMLERLAIRG